MNYRLILCALFISLNAHAQSGVYAEDVISDLNLNHAHYFMSSAWPAYTNYDLQDEADCYIGQNTEIQAKMVGSALPTNFLVWENHVFYLRNTVADQYFTNEAFSKKLSKKTDTIHVGILFKDLIDSDFEGVISNQLHQAKEGLQSRQIQLKGLNELKNTGAASAEAILYITLLKNEIQFFQENYDSLLTLYAQFKFSTSFFTRNAEDSKRGQRLKQKLDARYDTVDEDLDLYFTEFTEKKPAAINFLNNLFSSSTLKTIHSYPFMFEVKKNEYNELGLCPVGSVYWGIIMSKNISQYGRRSGLMRTGLQN
ncbi:MAG: hypothetical protein IT286_01255 [Proteobacteria bacterium]|jgi:hypothetical protein|nr:hypothetical protein [Pseudomonadota bacterium]